MWFDQHLKGTFTWPQSPQTKVQLKTASGIPSVAIKVDPSMPIQSVEVYYTQQGKAKQDRSLRLNRINKFWHFSPAHKSGNKYSAELAIYAKDKPLWVYANVIYKLPAAISGAGYYYGNYTSDTFINSSLVELFSSEDLQQAQIKATLHKTQIIEDFDPQWQKEWFTYKLSSWGRSTRKLYHPAYQAPSEGAKIRLRLKAEQNNLMVFSLASYSCELDIKAGVNEFILTQADFKNYDGQSPKKWANIAELSLTEDQLLRSNKDRIKSKKWQGTAPQFTELSWQE